MFFHLIFAVPDQKKVKKGILIAVKKKMITMEDFYGVFMN